MPLQTCNLAKGVAPRLHLPKSTKAKANTSQNGRSWKSHKRVESESAQKKEKASQAPEEEEVVEAEVEVADEPLEQVENPENSESNKDEVSTMNGYIILSTHSPN